VHAYLKGFATASAVANTRVSVSDPLAGMKMVLIMMRPFEMEDISLGAA